MNATMTITAAPIRKSFRVRAPQQKAFDVFLANMGRWWPKEHSVGSSPQRDVIIEPRPGGRWFEIAEDGTESMWGKVLEWDEPNRALLAWQLNAEFTYDPDFETQVEISFTADGDGTQIAFEHRGLEAFDGSVREGLIREMTEGWGKILEGYAEQAERD